MKLFRLMRNALTLCTVSALLLLATACAPGPIWPSHSYTNDYAAAGVIAGTAALMQVAGGGCSIAGCPPDMTCNKRSHFCERIPCGVRTSCAAGTYCDPRTSTCILF